VTVAFPAKRSLPLLLAIALAAWPANAAAGDAGSGLRYDTTADLSIALVATGLTLAADVAKPVLAPPACRVCERHADGSDAVNAVDRAMRDALRWKDVTAAERASDVTGFALAPTASIGVCEGAAAVDHRSREAPANALVVFEAVALSSALDEFVKFVVARQRPFAHYRDPAYAGPRNPDENLSFYSGHTALDFSMAAASATVASLRGYRGSPLVWATGFPVAALTGYLRIAADKHYFTDVLAGALFGTLAGVLVPLLVHANPSTPAATAMETQRDTNAAFVAGGWAF
jgi:membrane-associated phospholipid phosphatase